MRVSLMGRRSDALPEQFDLLWSVESISHYQRPEEFFASAAKLLKPGGLFAITDCSKRKSDPRGDSKFIHTIEKGMLVELQSMHDYERFLNFQRPANHAPEILTRIAPKRGPVLDIISDKAFWALA